MNAERVSRWRGLLLVLSLDRTEQFVPRFGLPVRRIGALRGIAQRAILDLDTEYELRASDADQWLVQAERIIQRAMAEATVRSGSATVASLRRYVAVYPPEPSDSAQEFWWAHIFWRATFRSDDRGHLQPPPLSPVRCDLLRRAVRRYMDAAFWTGAVSNAADGGEPQGLSPWEQRLMAQWDGIDPLTAVVRLVEWCAVRRIWRRLQRALDPHELGVLFDWGNLEAPRLGFGDWVPPLQIRSSHLRFER